MQDAGSGGSGAVSGWSLDFLGDWDTGNDTYYYTNEWAAYGGEAARQLVVDDGGIDTLNFAAITEAVTMSLQAGSQNTLLGHSLAISAGSTIENAVSGDGDDVLLGNDSDNRLRGMRGDDSLQGGEGDDWIEGGAGIDTAAFSGDWVDYAVAEQPDGSLVVTDGVGSDGADTLIGIEYLAFADGVLSVRDALNPPEPEPEPEPDPLPSPPEPTIVGTAAGRENISGTDGDDVIWGGGGISDRLMGRCRRTTSTSSTMPGRRSRKAPATAWTRSIPAPTGW